MEKMCVLISRLVGIKNGRCDLNCALSPDKANKPVVVDAVENDKVVGVMCESAAPAANEFQSDLD